MLEGLTSALISFACDVLELLPESPFVALAEMDGSEFQQILAYVNWFIPFGVLLRIFGVWLGGVGAYYVYQIVLRWIKVIE